MPLLLAACAGPAPAPVAGPRMKPAAEVSPPPSLAPVTAPRTSGRPNLARSPMIGFEPEKARLYPPNSQSTDPRHAMATQCIITDSAFLERTRPA